MLVEIVEVTLFSHCGFMLCTRMTVIDDGFAADVLTEDESPDGKKSKTKDPVALPPPPFIVETKVYSFN